MGSSDRIRRRLSRKPGDRPAADQPKGEDPTDPPKEDPPKEDPPKEDPPKEDPPKEDPPKEDPPKEDPPKEDPPKGEDPPAEADDADGSPLAPVVGIGGARIPGSRFTSRFEDLDLVGALPDLGFRPDAGVVDQPDAPPASGTRPVAEDPIGARVEGQAFDLFDAIVAEAPEGTPPTEEERQLAIETLTDFGVEGAAGLSDEQLGAALAEAAAKMLLGAESDSDLAAVPETAALDVAGAVELAGGRSEVNQDGSVTLFDDAGKALTTIPAGADGGDARAAALQALFNLPATSPVPTNETVGKIQDAQADGGSAVVHVDGSVDILDADGNLVEHVPTDLVSEVSQAFETAAEGASTVPAQLEALPGELSSTLDQAAKEIGAAFDSIFGSGEDDDAPAPAAGDAPAPAGGDGQPGAGGDDGEEDEEQDQDEGDDDGDDDGDGDDADADAAAEEAPPPADDDDGADPDGSGAGAAGTPNPDDIAVDPAAREAFLDSRLGAGQREDQLDAIALAEAGGVTDPADGDDPGDGVVGIDPATGETTLGPIRAPGGAAGPIVDEDAVVVTDRDLEELEIAAAGGGAAGPTQSEAPIRPPSVGTPPRSPVTGPGIAGPGPRGEADDDAFGAGALGAGAIASQLPTSPIAAGLGRPALAAAPLTPAAAAPAAEDDVDDDDAAPLAIASVVAAAPVEAATSAIDRADIEVDVDVEAVDEAVEDL